MNSKVQKKCTRTHSPLPSQFVITEMSDYLNLEWDGFGKKICFKLLSEGPGGCGKVHVSLEIVPYSWSIKG